LIYALEAGEQGPDIVAAGWPWSFNMDSVASGRSREVIRRWWRAGAAVLLLLTGVAAARWPGWSWQRVLDLAELGRVWWPLAVAGVLVVVLAPLRPLRRPVEGRVREPRWLWLLSDRGIGAATLAVATLGIAVMVVLLAVAAGGGGWSHWQRAAEAAGGGDQVRARRDGGRRCCGSVAAGTAPAAAGR
jgi:hypothetical protein